VNQRHATPQLIKDALTAHLDGLANYPTPQAATPLRNCHRKLAGDAHGIRCRDAKTQVLPVNGSREALFAFAQAVIDRTKSTRWWSAQPVYRYTKAAALLAGATPHFLNTCRRHYALNSRTA